MFVRRYPGPGGAEQISNEGGYDALWSPDGTEIFYRNGRRIMVVDVQTDGNIKVGRLRLLFDGPNLGNAKFYRAWDVMPDGQRFIAVERAPVSTLNVILNWFDELKRLVPTDP